ncbi:MAG: antitoxin [Candidatus Aegiribacteria sp.]|nr:antitoxin [Candidatus Aegiribacteria sp.]MBD3294880.1 antitoxin [Candidatus Fermentibacteria bacterium]
MRLTKEEKDILESVESGEWESLPEFRIMADEITYAAKSTMKKDKRVNIRMTERDYVHIQKVALREGLPYQTLISSILHKYLNGRLIERNT